MGKDKRARLQNEMAFAMWGIVVGSIVDVMRTAQVPNDLAHHFLDRLEEGTEAVLWGEAYEQAVMMLDAVRGSVPGND
jgi:hypothetical protein